MFYFLSLHDLLSCLSQYFVLKRLCFYCFACFPRNGTKPTISICMFDMPPPDLTYYQ